MAGFEDHFLPDLVPCPIHDVDEFLLFAQRDKISRYDLVTAAVEELPVRNLKNVIAIDFDLRNNCVYWADIILDVIGRQCFKSGTHVEEILVSRDLASIEGMALDWISNTLYFVDGVRAKIEFIRTDINHSGRMRRTVLGPETLTKPRGTNYYCLKSMVPSSNFNCFSHSANYFYINIFCNSTVLTSFIFQCLLLFRTVFILLGIALHPRNGYMFWTDWNMEQPSVNRANLDGTGIKKLFGKETVEWPNGITIDHIANRIYWVDAKLDYIGSSDLHGDGFHKIISKEDVVSHPFAVAVFKSQMYWDDWKRNAIFSSDKDIYTGVQVLVKPLTGLMDLKVCKWKL